MTNDALIKELAQREGISKALSKRIIKSLVGIIRGEVQAHGRQAVADLGVFTLRQRAATVVKNFGRQFPVPAHNVVHFKAASNWKWAVKVDQSLEKPKP